MSPFATLTSALMASPLSETVTFEHVEKQETVTSIKALCREPDVEGEYGSAARTTQDVRQFEILASDLAHSPAKGDLITRATGDIYEAQRTGRLDQLGLMWTVDAYLVRTADEYL